MREVRFEERFGEVRSVLQQAPGREVFDVLVGVLSSMSRQDAARFEVEVMPYARAGLERWYAQCPPGMVQWEAPLMVVGRVAQSAVVQGSRWLGLVRELGLMEAKGAVFDALGSPEREEGLARLEALSLRLAKPSLEQVARVLATGWARRLALLNLCGVALGDGLVGMEGSALRVLDVSQTSMSGASARVLEGFEGLEELDMQRLSAPWGQVQRLVREGRWQRLRRLSLGGIGFDEGQGGVALARASYIAGLEELYWSGAVGGDEAVTGVLQAARGLVSLRANTSGGSWALDEVLCGDRGHRMRRLEVSAVVCRGEVEGGELLEVVSLSQASAEALRAFCGLPELGRVRELMLVPGQGAEAAMVEGLVGARGLTGVEVMELSGVLTTRELERLLRAECMRGVRELRLWWLRSLDREQLRVLIAAREALPGLEALRVIQGVSEWAREEVAGTWLEGLLR
jgi:hypothetical protein